MMFQITSYCITCLLRNRANFEWFLLVFVTEIYVWLTLKKRMRQDVSHFTFLMANELKISGQCEKNLFKGGT